MECAEIPPIHKEECWVTFGRLRQPFPDRNRHHALGLKWRVSGLNHPLAIAGCSSPLRMGRDSFGVEQPRVCAPGQSHMGEALAYRCAFVPYSFSFSLASMVVSMQTLRTHCLSIISDQDQLILCDLQCRGQSIVRQFKFGQKALANASTRSMRSLMGMLSWAISGFSSHAGMSLYST
jgi:hypothetical protein